MNNLLIFFALPVAVIIISIALQKVLKCPALVASIIFSIFLIVTFVIDNIIFLIATIVYTILSFITAYLICVIVKIWERTRRINEKCCCSKLQTIEETNNCVAEQSTQGCTYQITNSDGVSARINIVPNRGNNSCSCRRR